jgi:hypothetical protein
MDNSRNRVAYYLLILIPVMFILNASTLIQCISDRTLAVERISPNGVADINNIKYKTLWRKDVALISIKTDNVLDYLFLSNSEYKQSLLELILQLTICILMEVYLIRILYKTALNTKAFYNALIYCLIAYVLAEFAKNINTNSWLANSDHKLNGYSYNEFDYNARTIIVLLTALFVLTTYKKPFLINDQSNLDF